MIVDKKVSYIVINEINMPKFNAALLQQFLLYRFLMITSLKLTDYLVAS